MRTWTRAQVADLLDVSQATLRSWERAGAAAPSHPSAFQQWTPAEYTHADVAMLQVVTHGHRIGMTGAHLKFLWDAMQRMRSYLRPGWSGVAVVDTAGTAWLVGEGVPGPSSVDEILVTLPNGTEICTVTRMEIPA